MGVTQMCHNSYRTIRNQSFGRCVKLEQLAYKNRADVAGTTIDIRQMLHHYLHFLNHRSKRGYLHYTTCTTPFGYNSPEKFCPILVLSFAEISAFGDVVRNFSGQLYKVR